MEYSHKLARSTTDTLEKLVAFIEERRRSDSLSADVAEFEKDVRALCSAVERAATTEELARFDVHAPAVRVDGVVHRFVLRSECEYLTSAGPVRVERNLYADRSGGGRALCPLERRAGVIRGYWTPRAAQLATWVTAHLVPGEAEQLFGRLGGMTPSRSTLDRLPQELSERWERQRAEFEQSLRLTEEVPQEAVIVAVSLDGVMVPMKAGQRKEKRAAAAAAGKPTRGPAGYCEAACATVTVYDHERAPLHTVRMGRMPESKKATIKGMLCDELAAVVAARPELERGAMAHAITGSTANCRGQPRSLAISEFPKGRKYLISLSFRGKASVRPAQVGGFDVNIIHSTAVRGRGDLVAYRWALWKLTAPWTTARTWKTLRGAPQGIKSFTKNPERPQNSVGKPG